MRLFIAGTILVALTLPVHAFTVAVSVNTALDTHAISPFIYGSNADLSGTENFSMRRQGGNRLTGYNWENNASNAGTDWNNSSDNYLTSVMGISNTQANTPGIVVTAFIDSCRKHNQFSLTTFQMAGYVARDKNGTVAAGEVAPSARWRQVIPQKPTAFSAAPDTADTAVYMDELMNFLDTKYAPASDVWLGGISLDNEPALWPSTHPLIHPAKPTCQEIINKSIALSTAIRRIDSRPLIFGPVTFGFSEMYDFQGASDWNSVKGDCTWFTEWYLDKMRQASQTAGKRLLDVFDVHWYSEATGNNERIVGATNPAARANAEARIAAPRTLWDSTYRENSWIAQWYPAYLPLIPKLQAAIKARNPGTKLSFSEYNYGGENHISGGLAMADILGIFGKFGVGFGTYWQMESQTAYTSAAFRLYRNVDGKNGAFGGFSVHAFANDTARCSAYASTVSQANPEMHIILLNKNYDSAMTASVTIASAIPYVSARVFAFDSSSSTITERSPAPAIAGNSFTYTVPRLTACHVVLASSASVGYAAPSKGNEAKGAATVSYVPGVGRLTYVIPRGASADITIVNTAGKRMNTLKGVTGCGSAGLSTDGIAPGGVYFATVKLRGCKPITKIFAIAP